ncbi:MAG: GLPGLI family protein [Prevotella sp.]|jgi:GLPGLI family protein|nr:GLPGLI family protein [Prevotella sp.]
MKNIILILLCLLPFVCNAQDKSGLANMNMSVTYHADYVKNTMDMNKKRPDRMILRISGQSSEFYSLLSDRRRVIQDSMLSIGFSTADIEKEKAKIPRSTQYYRVYKNYPNKGRLTYIEQMIKPWYRYEETLERPVWKLQDEKKEIIGYKCQKATTLFRGRAWIVWFTNEIPISDGPWKLWGLPGLILEAADANDIYHFTALGIKKNDKTSIIQPLKNQYINCTRKDLHKLKVEEAKDPLAFLNKSLGLDMKIKEVDSKGKEVSLESNEYIGMETDITN